MVKSTKKYMQSFIFFWSVIGLPVHVQMVFADGFSESAFSNHLLADRIGCIDGFDSLL